jgi:hypothetical protein
MFLLYQSVIEMNSLIFGNDSGWTLELVLPKHGVEVDDIVKSHQADGKVIPKSRDGWTSYEAVLERLQSLVAHP